MTKCQIRLFTRFLFALSIFLLTFLFTGCKCTRFVTVPEYHKVTVHLHDTTEIRDSVFIQDSIFTLIKGDTVILEKKRMEYRDRWRDRVVIDTFIQKDSIPVPVEKTKLSKLDRLRMGIGDFAVVLLIIFSIVLGLRRILVSISK